MIPPLNSNQTQSPGVHDAKVEQTSLLTGLAKSAPSKPRALRHRDDVMQQNPAQPPETHLTGEVANPTGVSGQGLHCSGFGERVHGVFTNIQINTGALRNTETNKTENVCQAKDHK